MYLTNIKFRYPWNICGVCVTERAETFPKYLRNSGFK